MQARELQRQSRVNFSRYPSLLARKWLLRVFLLEETHTCGNEAFGLGTPKPNKKVVMNYLLNYGPYFLMAIVFTVIKKSFQHHRTHFLNDIFQVELADSFINDGVAKGECNSIHWALTFGGGLSPVYLLPQTMYSTPFPKSKSITFNPMVTFNGQVAVGSIVFDVTNWVEIPKSQLGRETHGSICMGTSLWV